MPFQIEKNTLIRYTEDPGVTEIIIPETVQALEKECFLGCRQIVSAVLPDGLQEIPYRAFKNCKNLQKIRIPETVLRIEEAAFSSCERLAELMLPKTLESIGVYAFYGSERLMQFHLAGGVFRVRMNDIYQNQNNTALLKQFLCTGNPEQQRLLFDKTEDAKYKTAMAYYLLHTGQENDSIRKYAKRNVIKAAKFFMDVQAVDGLEELLKTGFVTKANIQKLIDYAIQNQYHESYLILLGYKNKVVGYQNPANKLKL